MDDWNFSPASRDSRPIYYFSDGRWLDEEDLLEHDPEDEYSGVLHVPVFTSDEEVEDIVRTTIGG